MTIEQLKAAYDARPFCPFVIHLADGSAIPVEGRELIMGVPSGRTIVVAQQDGALNIVGLSHITDLEVKPSPYD